ncbi:retinoblastoma-associated protein-like isoform X4 [Dreissena polymorpha]|uniref:retinoblastoma-associated protein-like isoform X2 n=1 Tax=Dreissena polymorpha TaxID=45954 RepID=UPI00226489CC|nr:retinoblastoma-associated protein-like isoform X2 [Dreissena polymorpha]XP_052214920.1 retinoblastoma-associated protein-like isoform X3 [Dreissena polymorpha]XP_052214921.1 retinoblastoma-associated protein-like isoform X4 [Dreissena polymorpha]
MGEKEKEDSSLLGKYCVDLDVPASIKSKALQLWKEVKDVSSEHDSGSVQALQWIPVVIYVAAIESSQPYGPEDPHSDKSSPCCSLGAILKASDLNFIKFSELMRQFRDRVDLSEVVRQHFSSVEKRYCIISPLFHRFDREWGTVFREEDQEQSVDETETVQDPKKLCWLLFLNAKDDILSGTEELIQTYHLLLCCLEFILRDSPAFLLHPPFDSLKLEHSAIGGSSPSLNFVQRLAEKFHTSLDELQAMQTTTQTYFESLKAANGNLDVTYLENQYLSRQKESGSLDELLYLQHEATLMPNNFQRVQSGSSTHNGLDTPVTPVRAAMNTVQQLKNLISTNTDHLQPLREHFQNCASNPERSITDRASQMKLKFLSHYLETSGNGQGAVAEQRYRQATNLYYRVMKRLLDIERERLAPLKDFSSLLNNDVFHRSLLACSTEIVLTTYNVSWSMTHSVLNSGDSKFHFPWVLDVFELYAFDFYKVLESYLKAEPNLTRDIIKHLTSIENRILDSVAWQSDSPVFDLLSRCGAMSSAYVSPCNDLISAENNNAAKAAEIYMSPSRGQATKGTNPGHIVIMSPRKGGVTGGVTMAYSKDSPETRAPDTPRRSHALTMFFNKVCRLGYHRLKTLADLLRITSETQQKIWTCFEFCIISRPELLKDRHLDQIMMCSVYGICKVSDCEIRFKDIVKEYSTMSHAMSDVYKQALLENGTHDSIISFYNRVFMQCMKNYILQFAKPVQPNLSPLPKPVNSSLNSSPVYSIPGRKNFYISPLKESPFKPPSSPSNMTPRSRKLYSFGELLGSAEKLKSINESMAAFKSRGNLPYVTTVRRTSSKRLSFDEMPSSDIINGNDITEQDVVVKKKRVTPPAVVSLSAPGQRNGDTDKESNSK